MIKINSFAIGNKECSYIFDGFKSGINIIHSDDNNKGKTIVSQGIFYALGNTPIFPAGFEDYDNYYYVVQLDVNDKKIMICRKKDFFVVNDGTIKTYDSVNDFKRYFDANIFELPTIVNNGIAQKAGLELFFEMVFLPQDKRITSNIINKGRYSKDDYYEFLFSYMNCSTYIDPQEIEKCVSEIKELEENRKVLKRQRMLLKSKKMEASFATYTASKSRIDEKMKKVEKCKSSISELVKTRNRLINKVTRNELLLSELNSLKRNLETGKLFCAACGSDKIFFESKQDTIKFEISDADTREQIKNIILDRIQISKEDIKDIEGKLKEKRAELAEIMNDKDVSLENLLFYKKDIIDAASVDSKIILIDSKIEQLKNKLDEANKEQKEGTQSKEKVLYEFVKCMQKFYDDVEPDDPLKIDDIFTKNYVNFSGSQGALFLISRLYAASVLMGIDFPIFIDHFRGGEISSIKENLLIDSLKKLNKQVILSCTLKNEEEDKYEKMINLNSISFDCVEKFHLLKTEYNEKFKSILKNLNIDITLQ